MFPQRLRALLVTYITLCPLSVLLGLLWIFNSPLNTHAQSQPEVLGTLSGTVRNEQGEPLPNILVLINQAEYVSPYATAQTTTDAQGGYRFAAVQTGNYLLRFQDSQNIYAPAYYADAHFYEDAKTVPVSGNDVAGVDIKMKMAGAISVTLTNASPVTLTFYSLTLYLQTASGHWKYYRHADLPFGITSTAFVGLAAANYRLCEDGKDMNGAANSAECYDNVLPEGQQPLPPNAMDIAVEAGVTTTVAMAINDITRLEGYVFSPGHHPLAGIPVVLKSTNATSSQVAQSDDNGYFRFPYVPNGSYTVIFNSSGYGPNSYFTVYYPDDLTGRNPTEFLFDPTTHFSITQELPASSSITGKVVLPDGTPLSWQSIDLYRPMADGSWNPSSDCLDACPLTLYDYVTGSYTVTHLLAGRYRIGAHHYLYDTSSFLTSFYGGNSLESAADIVLATGETKPDINIAFGDTLFDSTISGRATAAGLPLAGIKVGIFPQYFIAHKSPVPLISTTTDENGRYNVGGLSIGSYLVGFRDPHGIYATTFYTDRPDNAPYTFPYFHLYPASPVVITQSGTLENIDAQLPMGGAIRGRIRTQNGQPAGGFAIQVVAYPLDSYSDYPLPFIDVRSDANGYFEITGVPPGEYILRADVPAGSGPFITISHRYHVAEELAYYAKTVVVEAGKSVENQDIYFFFTPTSFLPVISGNLPSTPAAEAPIEVASPAP